MAYIRSSAPVENVKTRFYKKRWFKILASIAFLFLLIGGVFAWKTGSVLNKISQGGLLKSLAHSLPGVPDELKGEADGRINIALLGMRGANDPAGGTLADTIEILSIAPKENKVSLISVPRDLFVDNPASGYKTKLNAVYALGEQKGAGQGMVYMEQALSTITGVPVNYAVSINFDAFKQLVDAIGGVNVTLDKPFEEGMQFNQPHVCDSFFTIPTGKWENKIVKHHVTNAQGVSVTVKRKIPKYPLCTAPKDTLECGGDFKLDAGTHNLDGEKALCYARARETSNDFERAKRQQQVIQSIKDKLLSAGTLTDFGKINGVLDSLGNNVKTDMQAWELKHAYDLYNQMKGYTMYQRVIDSSNDVEVGLVYGVKDPTSGDILVPKGDNFDKIHTLFQNIFTLSPEYKENISEETAPAVSTSPATSTSSTTKTTTNTNTTTTKTNQSE